MKKRNQSKQAVPNTLTMKLFESGMSPMHRAGLGGLACTLRYIEKAYHNEELCDELVPGGPWKNGKPPWTIEPLQITLDFDKQEATKEFLKRLFAIAFDLKKDMIYLPGQHIDQQSKTEVIIQLQQGITLTYLQHGLTRQLDKKETTFQYEVESKPITLSWKKCYSYKHQTGWNSFCNNRSQLQNKLVEIIGPLNPGAVIRHVAFQSQTKIEEVVSLALPLYFSIVGTLALPINRGSAVLLIPEVNDLIQFSEIRSYMTPISMADCRITSPGDAALQAQIRIRASREIQYNMLPACHAITFQPTPWASQQKSRVDILYVLPGNDQRLKQFELALLELPPRIRSKITTEKQGKGKNINVIERTENFWVDSVVRPLVADNLAQGKRWYEGFTRLMRQIDPVSKKPIRDKILFEKRGLKTMIEKIPWDDQGESIVIRAVHEAMRRRYGSIADENQNNPTARKNRWSGEYDRWRLAFAGAKTPAQFRRSLCDLLSRAGINPVLKDDWSGLLPMLNERNWELTRDLSLLALASYSGKGAKEIDETKLAEANEETSEDQGDR